MVQKKSKKAKRVKIVKKANATAELTRLGAALRGLGGLGGSALGGLVGMPSAGAATGRSLGATISRWLGSGDYEVSTNSIVKGVKSGSIPMMHQAGQSIVVRHKEYLGDVFSGTGSPTGFSVVNSYTLNPGLAASFPWLAGIAANYQEYTWRGLVFHYVSTSGNATGTNTSLGTVAMATNYRATAPAYTSRLTMLNEYCSTDSKPSEDFVHPIECDPKENPYAVQYVRSGAVPAGEDPKTYDLGVTSIATQGMQTASENLGELWVSYEVELRKPIANALLASTANYGYGSLTGAGLGHALGTTYTNTGGSAISGLSGQTLSFARGLQGTFVLTISTPGASLTTVQSYGLSYTNCISVLVAEPVASTMTSTGGTFVWSYILHIPDGTLQASVTASSTPYSGSASATSVYFTQITNSI